MVPETAWHPASCTNPPLLQMAPGREEEEQESAEEEGSDDDEEQESDQVKESKCEQMGAEQFPLKQAGT